MRNIWKRSLSMLLALVLVLGMVPVNVQAAAPAWSTTEDYVITVGPGEADDITKKQLYLLLDEKWDTATLFGFKYGETQIKSNSGDDLAGLVNGSKYTVYNYVSTGILKYEWREVGTFTVKEAEAKDTITLKAANADGVYPISINMGTYAGLREAIIGAVVESINGGKVNVNDAVVTFHHKLSASMSDWNGTDEYLVLSENTLSKFTESEDQTWIQISYGNADVKTVTIRLESTQTDSTINVAAGDAEYYVGIGNATVKQNIFNAIYKGGIPTLTADDVQVQISYLGGWPAVSETYVATAAAVSNNVITCRIYFEGNETYAEYTSEAVSVTLVDNRSDVSVTTPVTIPFAETGMLEALRQMINANPNDVTYYWGSRQLSDSVLVQAARENPAGIEVTVTYITVGNAGTKPSSKTVTVTFTGIYYDVPVSGGTVNNGASTVRAYYNGESVIITVDPTTGYTNTLAVTGGMLVKNADGTYTLSGVNNETALTVDSQINYYTVTFTDGGYNVFADVTESVAYNENATAADVVANRPNYTFAGWYLNGQIVTLENLAVTEDITLVASWAPVNDNNDNDLADEDEKYTIIYVDGFGTELKKFTDVAHNAATPTIADPEKEGYKFLYWEPQVQGNVETPTSGTTITYTAKWIQLGKIAVTFVDRGNILFTFEYYEGDCAVRPEAPVWDVDHDFLGWYNGSEEFDFDTVFTAESTDLVLTAKWQEDFNRDNINDEEQPKYTVTYMDGYTQTPILSDTVLVNMSTPVVANPVRSGYTFAGWDVTWSSMVTADVTYTATWIKDANQNEVDDDLETITVIIQGTGTVVINGTQTGTLLYDSTVTDTITITATPVLNGNVSTTYVSSIVVDDGVNVITAGGYNNYTYTYTFAASGSQTVTVTFRDAKFSLKNDNTMTFYTGIQTPSYKDLYTEVVIDPSWDETFVQSVKYKAREAGVQTVDLSALGAALEDVDGTAGMILKGAFDLLVGSDGQYELELDELWLDVGTKIPEVSVNNIAAAEIERIKALIASAGSLSDYWAVAEAIGELGKVITAESYYAGAHDFGYNPVQTDYVEEILHIVYENEAMRIEDKTVVIKLTDDRANSVITGSNVQFEYKDYTEDSLMDAIGALLTDANGEIIDGVVYKVENTVNRNVGTYTITLKFDGNADYKPAEATVTLTVVQAPTKLDVPNVNVIYGEGYNALPVITNKYGQAISIDTIRFIIGLDVADLDVDGDGIKGLTGKVQLLLPEDLQNIINLLPGMEDGATMTLSELVEFLNKNITTLESFGLTQEMVDMLNTALETVSGVVEAGDLEITIGGGNPENIGAYLTGAVTVDSNYKTAFDVGYIIIKPNAQKVYLDFNYKDANSVFTWELLQHVDLNASAFNDAAFAVRNDAATALVQNLFFGIDEKGELVLSMDSAALGNGAYTQLSFIAEFGNEFYYAVPIVRAFVIAPNILDVEIVDGQGNAQDEFNYKFDNTGKTHFVLVNGQFVEAEIRYVGIQTNTKTYNSTQAPKHAGAYVAYVIYIAYDENGELTGAGFDTVTVVIEPADSSITVTGGTVDYDGKEHSATVDAQGAGVTAPDFTLISGTANVTGDVTEIGLNAIVGNVNVDFPKWLDKILSVQFADAYSNGVAAEDLIFKLKQHQDDLVELGIGADMIADVVAVMEKIPAAVTVTFDDGVTYTAPGVYVFVGIVSDSDHIPAADTGLLVIRKEYSDFGLNDTKVTWDGQGHFADTVNPENSDYIAVIIDRENNIGNIVLEDDMNTLVAILEETLGRELPKTIDITSFRSVIDEILNNMDRIENMPVSVAEALDQIQKVLEKLPKSGVISINDAMPSAVGTYEVYAITYSVQYKTSASSAVLEILPVQVKVEVENVFKYYGQADPAVGSAVQYFDHLGNELADAGVVTVELQRTPGQNVGKYSITATVTNTDEKNYKIVAVTQDAILEIKPAEITITVDNKEKVYGENDPVLTYNAAVFEGKGMIGSDLVITLDRVDGEAVGTYAIIATMAENANYKIVSNADGVFTIKAKEITLADVVLNGALTYNGTEQTQAIVVTEGVTYRVSGNTGTNAGVYTLTVTGIGNYTGNVELTWTIDKAEVVITLENVTIDVDDAIPQPNYVVTYVKGQVPANLLNLAVRVDVVKNAVGQNVVGQYAVVAEYTESDNWIVTVEQENLTVVLGNYVCMDMQTGIYYDDLSNALEDVDNAEAETIKVLQNCTEKYVIIAPGTTLDLSSCTVSADFVVGFAGSHVTGDIYQADSAYGKLVAPKDQVKLDKDAYYVEDVQRFVLPVWDNREECYIFGRYIVNEEGTEQRGFHIDEENDQLVLVFKHKGTGDINQTLFADDGSSNNGVTVLVRITWVAADGDVVSQDYLYSDENVMAVMGSKDFKVVFTEYSACTDITVTAIIASDTGVEIAGQTHRVN